MPTTAPVADWVTIPDLYRDPFPIYDRLRAEGGVHWVPSVGRYLITSYEAVHATEFDQETFSANEEGSLQIRAMGHSMLRRDDPEHYVERVAWQPVLRPGAVRRTWTAVFERNARRYLDEMIAKGPDADLIWDFAAPYAAENLREILGFHNVDQTDLQRWSQTLIDATGNYADDPEVWACGERSFAEVDAALDEMLAWHSTHPDASLISSLLATPSERMPLERIRANVKMTIGGGLNEPRDALGVAAWALLSHPEQRAAVEADPSLWPAAFDETIRWIAPIGLYSRQTTREVELAGITLPARARLGICILSANRDERIWPEAERFDVRREVKPHLAFSKGVHVCLGAWVAKAEVAQVGLPALFSRLEGLSLDPDREARVGGWVFRGMLDLPVRWDRVRDSSPAAVVASAPASSGPAPRVAVVGAGPAGCFTAAALQKAIPGVQIDVFDRLPVPYGLVRYGIAADHQGTKSVTRQFEAVFAAGARFHGGVDVDAEALAALRAKVDAVVLATGLPADTAWVHGADLGDRAVGAGALIRTLNGHPDAAAPASLGRTVAVVGSGNVAMDVVRLLARDVNDLAGSDVDDEVRDVLVGELTTVHVVSRSAPSASRFDPVMVRELASLAGVSHTVHLHGAQPTPGKDARVDAVAALASASSSSPRVRVEWWFDTAVAQARVDEGGVALDLANGEHTVDLRVDTVVTAIGFTSDASTPVVPARYPDGRVEPGLYVAGWLRTGPRGALPDQRDGARGLARLVAADLSGRPLGTPGLDVPQGAVDFDGWRRIDRLERLAARPGRVRAKLRTRSALHAAARDESIALPELERGDGGGLIDDAADIRVVFATESGNAEQVAEHVARRLGGAAARDVVGLSPAALDRAAALILISSTYGDGEVPRGARDFLASLAAPGLDLSGLRFAVFGLGDRSYHRTYSRGSELLAEALVAAGAERVGEYGRHDAGGPWEAIEVVDPWLEGVVADLRLVTPAVR